MCQSMTNLHRREGGTYYVRVRVPLDLVEFMGRKEVWRSLRTKDPKEAKRRCRAALDELDRTFDEQRRHRDGGKKPAPVKALAFNEGQLAAYAQRYYASLLQDDQQARISGPTPEGFEIIRNRTASILTKDLGRGDLASHVNDEADAIFDELGYRVRPSADDDFGPRDPNEQRPTVRRDEPAYRQLAHVLMRAKVEAFARMAERDEGDFKSGPADPLLTAPAPDPATVTGETLGKLVPEYLAGRSDLSAEWRTAMQACLDDFLDFAGRDTPVAQITKKTMREFVALLRQYPQRGSMFAGNEAATFMQIIERNRTENRPTIAPRTINKRITAVSEFMNWCVKQDLIDTNPAEGQHVPESKREQKRDPFTVDQMNALFRSPLFVGCHADDTPRNWAKPGNALIRDHRYWTPLVCAFTGARSGEVLNLWTDDVEEVQGVWCVSINRNRGKSVKTDAGVRRVPVHSTLEALGFVDHVRREREARGPAPLFPGLPTDKLDRTSSPYGRDFGKYLRHIGVKADERLVGHSFRHAFVDALRRVGYPDATIGLFVGHAQLTVTAGYGSLPQFSPAQRREIIENVTYPGLDLSHLLPAPAIK